jgi:hypothetical protein
MISQWDDDFKKFFNYLLIFAFVMMFWNGFKADMAKRDGTNNLVKNKTTTQQVRTVQSVPKTYRQVYVNNNYGGPATVYYVRQ